MELTAIQKYACMSMIPTNYLCYRFVLDNWAVYFLRFLKYSDTKIYHRGSKITAVLVVKEHILKNTDYSYVYSLQQVCQKLSKLCE